MYFNLKRKEEPLVKWYWPTYIINKMNEDVVDRSEVASKNEEDEEEEEEDDEVFLFCLYFLVYFFLSFFTFFCFRFS
jgi:hypothetical protein